MIKIQHEIRDVIHVFVRLDSQEREIVDSVPFQRLRNIHQLAMSYLIYPGATHRRFEHSLGVMELAGKVFDIITTPENLNDEIKSLLPEVNDKDKKVYWRRILRIAALCHDLGHLPFSHAAENDLLPEGWNHERLTREIILSNHMAQYWKKQRPPLDPNDIVKLAVGKKYAPDLEFSDWESILSEIIVGDAFGVDRMDYLLRDSHHVGVVYGKFDHHRLIDTLRILTPPQQDKDETDKSVEPTLGIEEGGLQSAEALLLARYFMYSQVYFHSVRRIYDIHLKDFLSDWLEGGKFSTDVDKHLSITDNEVTAAFYKASREKESTGHIHANRIVNRKHFKVLYELNPDDEPINPEAVEYIFQESQKKFKPENIRIDRYKQKGHPSLFPVLRRDGSIVNSLAISKALQHVPLVNVGYVFADRAIIDKALDWVKRNKNDIITIKEGEDR
ncbi:HD domain-containing protein [bacterium]|nr:HD domain-containing protein [bacterium]